MLCITVHLEQQQQQQPERALPLIGQYRYRVGGKQGPGLGDILTLSRLRCNEQPDWWNTLFRPNCALRWGARGSITRGVIGWYLLRRAGDEATQRENG